MPSDLVAMMRAAALAHGRAVRRVANLKRQLRSAIAAKRLTGKTLRGFERAMRADLAAGARNVEGACWHCGGPLDLTGTCTCQKEG